MCMTDCESEAQQLQRAKDPLWKKEAAGEAA
jgi:hypothetical protein